MMPAKEDVYGQVAKLHMQALDQGFLARLGPRFLSLLYEKMDRTPGYHLITQVNEGRVIGFISGGPGMGRLYRALLSSWPRLIGTLIPSLLVPRNVRGIIELLRHKSESDNTTMPEHELLSIAVASEAQGSGVAQELYLDLIRKFDQSGVNAFKIVVGEKLERAHQFYLKMGAEPISKTKVHKGAASTVFVASSNSAQ